MKLLEIKIDTITTLVVHYEDQDPIHHFDDAELAKSIMKEQESNVWAWFGAEFVSQLPETNFRVSTHLGCCSYESFDDFKKNAYFDDLVFESQRLLKAEVENVIESYKKNAALFE